MRSKLPFFSVHQHSRFSANDALPHVSAVVAKAAELDYPALALTDHGTVAGVIQLYKECRKRGVEPMPGVEAYVLPDASIAAKHPKYNHLTIAAYNSAGYRNLVKLATQANLNFHYRPRLDMADFAAAYEAGATEGIMVATGCHFGLIQTLLREQGYTAAMRATQALATYFPKVFVEIQHHGIYDDEHDSDRSVAIMVELANEVGLPYIVTSDAHYVNETDRPLHDGLKRMVSFSDDPDDAIFPGIGGYHMPDRAYLARFIEPDILDTAIANLHDFLPEIGVKIPELDKFQLQCPDITYGGNPDQILADMVDEAWTRGEGNFNEKLGAERIAEELDVIRESGMASYIILVADVCRFMLEERIWFHARGSASGSLVCRLLGITQIDPLQWGLRFDRFLSRDRTRPPDVDLDIQHDQRERVAAYLESKYVVRQIATHMTYSITGDVDAGEESRRGSLMQRYHSLTSKRGQPHRSWHQIPRKDQDLLNSLGSMELFSGYGTHPAGFVLADNEETIDQLPLTYIASSKRILATYDKKDIEALGMVKLDVLGLKEITAFRTACDIVGISDPHEIPLNDKATIKRIARGDTEGVFQLKGYAMKLGCKSLQPRNIADLAAAQALFRPAARNSGATDAYLARRRNQEVVPERHRDIMIETKDTYGVLLYQEQVIGVLRRMNMGSDELTDMLDAVKSSGKRGVEAARKTIEDMTPRIEELATIAGWSAFDVAWLSDALVAYADYSFNKAHAATYAEVAYRAAWMSEHHPVAFWTGMLSAFSGTDKERELIADCRRHGVRVLGAHVNKSKGLAYTPEIRRHAVRRGLLSIKGVGKVAAQELIAKGPFDSLRDIGEKCVAKKVTGSKHLALGKDPITAGGVIAALFDAGALDDIPENHEETAS